MRRNLSEPADADQHEFITQDFARVHLLNGHDAELDSGRTNFSIGPKRIGKLYPKLSLLSLSKKLKGTTHVEDSLE